MPGPFYYAWSGPDEAFDPAVHNREDEQVFTVTISHAEGGFPSLVIELVNPRVGLLAAGRNLWCWLSWYDGTAIRPIYRGRLVGVPTQITDEVVSLTFISRPEDYTAQVAALALSLQVAPYWDPIWITTSVTAPDTVLEARPQLWHIDRLSLVVTASDILTGEDGTLVVTADEHFYDAMTVTFADTPLRTVAVTGTVSWTQTGAGEVDLTHNLVQVFQAAGSVLPYPCISTLDGDGLSTSWPVPGASIGAGWTVGPSSSLAPATWLAPRYVQVKWIDNFTRVGGPSDLSGAITGYTGVVASFEVSPYQVKFTAQYALSRPRSETVTFTLAADVQAIITEAGAAEEDTISLSSNLLDQPIDPDGECPLVNPGSNSYFKTDRGQQSFQFLVAYARAKLIARARAVDIGFGTTWQKALDLSCRWSVQLFDPRLPGGSARGKVKAYTLISGDGGTAATVTIGCAVGHDGTVIPDPGVGCYVDDGYCDPGLQATTAEHDCFDGSVVYQSFDDFVLDDDGVDLNNMTADSVLESISLLGGLSAQISAVYSTTKLSVPAAPAAPVTMASIGVGSRGGLYVPNIGPQPVPALPAPDPTAATVVPDPVSGLKANPTKVTVVLVPVDGGSFLSAFAPTVSVLKIPKFIDLEAAT